MDQFPTLKSYLEAWTADDVHREAVADTVIAIADGCRTLSGIIRAGSLAQASETEADTGVNADGDKQTELDVLANEILIDAIWAAPVSYVMSEELDEPATLRAFEPLYVAIDPLDGSSNIDNNVSIGTIFSVLPMARDADTGKAALQFQPGVNQLAAGYVVYGPQTALVLTVGAGTQIFTLDPDSNEFRLTDRDVSIPASTNEFTINASNYRHWDHPVRGYIDDCLEGLKGPRGRNYNMRWIASLVAEAHRIFRRGGIFLYPGDQRHGYNLGRLRLIYEANPIAFLVEQAGGRATTGREDILHIQPASLHERTPLIFGSIDEVETVDRYHRDLHPVGERSPLFSQRGLFRS
jgi:fructose-1,6-bisphosphatase I